MKRAAVAAFAAAALALFQGCASVRYSDVGGRTMVEIVNTGWYLFNFIPLAFGDPEAPNENKCRFFSQTTTLENNVRLLDYAVAKRKAKGVRDVRSYWTDENVLLILFKRHTVHTSAELLP